jgi:threonine synthase
MIPVFATSLHCLRCGRTAPVEPSAYLCPHCGPGVPTSDPGIFDVQYDYAAAAPAFLSSLSSRRRDIFRFLPLLPLEEAGNVLPVGDTPLIAAPRLAARLGLQALYLKDETRNPTRCLKDRATAIALSIAQAHGYHDLYCASAGNAAISLAGFCSHQGLTCHTFVPRTASPTRLDWLYRFGAQVHVSQGDYDQAFQESEEAGSNAGWYSRNCAFNPYLVEGKKTVAFEIAEQLDWQSPDLVVAPVGDGCTLGAVGKGFRELRTLGQIERLPRLLGVQAEALQPAVRRFHRQMQTVTETAAGETLAASIAVRRPRNYLRLRSELEASHGSMLAVPDSAMLEAQQLLAQEAGIIAEVTSAATLAGLLRLISSQALSGQRAVLIITGGRLDSNV